MLFTITETVYYQVEASAPEVAHEIFLRSSPEKFRVAKSISILDPKDICDEVEAEPESQKQSRRMG